MERLGCTVSGGLIAFNDSDYVGAIILQSESKLEVKNPSRRFSIGLMLLSFLSLILAYEMFLHSPVFSQGGGVALSIGNNNLIKIQRYDFDYNNPETVFVGTSATNRLPIHKLSNRVYNLANAHMGVKSGLFVINRKQQKPKNVVVEINYALTFEAGQFIRDYYSSFEYQLAKYFKFFRAEFRPVVVAKFLMKKSLGQHLTLLRGMPQRVDAETGQLIVNETLPYSPFIQHSDRNLNWLIRHGAYVGDGYVSAT